MFSKIANWVTKSSEKFESVVTTIPTYTVEEIHEAFDKAEDEVVSECEKLLAELKIPTETQIEKKAELMKQIGFNSSETVTQAQVLKERTEEIKEERNSKKLIADTINEFRVTYPKEKFITEDKLNELCKKYNLMYAPIKNYIKDVPEKNLLDIKNRKSLLFEHSIGIIRNGECLKTKFFKEYKMYFQNPGKYVFKMLGSYLHLDLNTERNSLADESNYLIPRRIHLDSYGREEYKVSLDTAYQHFTRNRWSYMLGDNKDVNKSGLFGAAPKTPPGIDSLDQVGVNVRGTGGFGADLKTIFSPDSNVGLETRAQAAMNLTGDAIKAMYTNKDGSLDKRMIISTLSAIPSYLDAKKKADQIGLSANEFNEQIYNDQKSQFTSIYQSNLPMESFGIKPPPVKAMAQGGMMNDDGGILSIKLTPVQGMAMGGEIPVRQNQGGVSELDLRAKGGYIPVGIKEKADDVPAMLSKNEFVFTADAVRGAGGGDINKGAQKMYKLMKSLEKKIKKTKVA